MSSAKLYKEIHVSTSNDIGVLANVCTTLSNARINIEAMCAYGEGNKGYFMILTFDQDKSQKVLEKAGYNVKTQEVVVVTLDNKIGAADLMTNKISKAGINVNYCYGSAGDGKNTFFIMSTEDNKKALNALK